ncbi:MAG: (d)CMP kinase [Armatimonadetes bacterium]|nr:(d)CMP kinase [Armatimonadota bacterium]
MKLDDDERPEVRIAIDGPAGSGKSTLARSLAQALDYLYVDTGAMYRAVAYKALQEGLDPAREEDQERVGQLAGEIEFHFVWEDGQMRLLVDDEDVSEVIRTPDVERLSSPVSAIPKVREELVAAQKTLGQTGGIVMEGRDIGTVVLPDADVKLFLIASPEERARRRWRQLRERGISRPYETVLSETIERDRRDSSRPISPLKPAEDAVLIDSTDLTQQQVLERALEIVRQAQERQERDA